MADKRKFTQKLIIIILSLIVCVVALVTMTYGLFTSENDSFIRVSSAKVKIDLLMADELGEYVSIRNGNGEIFSDGQWEPGQTRFAFLMIKSESNVRVKYSMRIDALNEEMIGGFEYLVINEATVPTDIKNYAQLKERYNPTLLENGMNLLSGENYVYLEPGEAHYYVVALHMLPECDNSFQGKSFMLDLNVIAVQGNYTTATETESDSVEPSETESNTESETASGSDE